MIPRQTPLVFNQLYTSDLHSYHYYLLPYKPHAEWMVKTKYQLDLSRISQIVAGLTDTLPEQLHHDLPMETDWHLTYVPVYWQTKITRRFDMNQIIAKKLSRQTDFKYIKTIKNTSAVTQGQCGSRNDRIKNAATKFALRRRTTSPRNIIIIDDVVATGSTMKACQKLLNSAGAQNVVWVSIAH